MMSYLQNEAQDPTIEEMKLNISRVGGLFYQYRPCRRNSFTVYDIENIRHGVVYAQTPLNMNDPFDSMIGFSADKFYENCIDTLLNSLTMDESLKIIIASLLKHRLMGNIAELLNSINTLKRYLNERRRATHQTKVPFLQFIKQNADMLYRKMPNALKGKYNKSDFLAFSILISALHNVEISEESIVELYDLEDTLDNLYKQAIIIQNTIYEPEIRKFLSQLTVSCFSVSGWDNQLMWSHYANSYSGICIEYDFNKIKDFIGFIYPVEYTKERPTLTLQDLGIGGFQLEKEDKIIKCETNISRLFSYLLSKNTCWDYEKEWRIINIGKENTPIFIPLPCIKSITLGIKVDYICRLLIIEICKEKNIPCYQLSLDKEKYQLSREIISENDDETPFEDSIDYFVLLSNQTNELGVKIQKNADIVAKGFESSKFEKEAFRSCISDYLDLVANSYYQKHILNHIIHSSEKEINQQDIPEDIFTFISSIDTLVSSIETVLSNLRSAVETQRIMGNISFSESLNYFQMVNDVGEIAEKIKFTPWHSLLQQKNTTEA